MSLPLTELHRSDDAEQAVLTGLISNPEGIASLSEGIRAEHFYQVGNRLLFSHVISMAAEGKEVSLPTLTQRLMAAGDLDKVGGPAEVTHVAMGILNLASVLQCKATLRDLWLKREAVRVMLEFSTTIGTAEDTGRHLLCAAEALQSLDAGSTTKHRTMKQLVSAAVERYGEAASLQGQLRGISTGFPTLDAYTGGLCPGHLWVIGGGTSDGKSAFTQQIMLSIGTANHAGAIYTLEMSDDENVDRFFGQDTRITSDRFNEGTFSHEECRTLRAASNRLSNMPMHIRDVSGIRKTELLADMRLLWRVHGVKVFAIDYGQLIASEGKHFSREREVADISASLKAFAKQTKSTVIFVSQLNEDGRLRESRAIGFDADKAMRLRVPTMGGKDETLDDSRRILHLDKNRGGQRFRCLEYDFHGPTFSFINERELTKS